MKTKLLAITLAVLMTTGCATQSEKLAASTSFYSAQQEFVKSQASAQRPIFEMQGVEGQTIELRGVKSFVVWGGNNGQQAQLQMAPVQKSEFVEGLSVIKDGVLGVLPYALGAAAIRGVNQLGDNIERAGTAGYSKIQAPGAVTNTTNTTTSNANQANTTTTSSANQANTTTTSSANQANTSTTTGANSVVGSGSVSTPNTSTITNPPAQIPAGTICTVTATGTLNCK